MTVKVFELAKEMGVQSRDLVAKAHDLGIDVKNHMSVLSDADAGRLKGDTGQSAKPQTRTRKPPIGKPIVDEKFLASKRKPPIGKPVVDSEMLARREKEKAKAAAGTAEPSEQKPAAPAPAAEKPAEKPAAAPAEKSAAEKPAAKPAEQKPAEKPAEPAVKKVDPVTCVA